MSLIAAAPDLPLYLQMSKYTKGSKAVMELRTERFLQEQAASQAASQVSSAAPISNSPSDDELITGSIGKADGETEDAGFSFDDFLDTINPLQHLPVVSTLYRELTGDQIEPAARIIGGAVYGGPLGAGLALADTIFEEATGANAGAHIMSWLNGAKPEKSIARAAPLSGASQVPTTTNLSPEIINALATISTRQSVEEETTHSMENLAANNPLVGGNTGPIDISAAMSAALERYSALSPEQSR